MCPSAFQLLGYQRNVAFKFFSSKITSHDTRGTHTGRARARTVRVHGSDLAWDIRIVFPYREGGLRKVKRLVSTPERSGFPTHNRAAGSSTTHMIISTRRIRPSMGRGESGPDKVLGHNCDPVVIHRGNS
jgi:hypothetical protein